MIHVLAFVTAKPGQRAAVLEIFKANVPAVLAEEGCIEYGAAVDVAGASPAFGPDSFVVIEKWASPAALKAHAAAPHMAAYLAKVKPMLEFEKRAIHVLDPV
jgi:quinol monooxygenase YgiN